MPQSHGPLPAIPDDPSLYTERKETFEETNDSSPAFDSGNSG